MEDKRFLKLSKADHVNAEQPKDKKTWVEHGIAEFFGSILLSLLLAGLSTVVTGSGEPNAIEHYFFAKPAIGFYAGFIAVGLVLVIFLRWSCDLNPAVSVYRMITGRNTYRYGFYKIVIQMVGGIVAGLIIYGVGHASNGDIANYAIDSEKAAESLFETADQSSEVGAIMIFVGEMIATAILLMPIFSPSISDKYRDLMIMFIISLAVWLGIMVGSAALNPARGLAQQVPALFFGAEQGATTDSRLLAGTLAMLAGTFAAPFFLVAMQELSVRVINPLLTKGIHFKNTRTDKMEFPHSGGHIEQEQSNENKPE